MAINNWLIDERPREKLLVKGAAVLSDAELLAILLRIGSKGKTAIELARELLVRYGGLRNLLSASSEELCQCSGVGPAKYSQLQAAMEIARRYLQAELEHTDVLTNSIGTKHYLAAKLGHHKQEVFACLFLDCHNRIICYEELFFGTVTHSAIYPREVVKKILRHNAAAVIFAHNHPSGIAEPSRTDKDITKKLIKALKLIDVQVLDHVVIGGEEIVSFAEQGFMR